MPRVQDGYASAGTGGHARPLRSSRTVSFPARTCPRAPLRGRAFPTRLSLVMKGSPIRVRASASQLSRDFARTEEPGVHPSATPKGSREAAVIGEGCRCGVTSVELAGETDTKKTGCRRRLMARRQIQIEFSLTEGGEDRVAVDLDALGVSWPWLLRELARLSDDAILALFSEDEGDQAAGPEGRWGLLELDPYLLICQLQIPEAYWRLGLGQGVLKIVRLYRCQGAEVAIEEMRRLEEDAEQRWREEQEGGS